jgi:SAM-dependent methyltransferase
MEVRTLSSGRRVAHVARFRHRYVSDHSWENRARRKLPERVVAMRRRLDDMALHGFDVKGGRILEVGTGPGLDTRLLAGLTQGAVYSVDIRQEHSRLEPGRRPSLHAFLDACEDPRLPPFSDPRYRLLAMDGRRLAFAEDAFDLVVVKNTLKLVASWELVVRECLRVLRPGGLLAVSDSPFTGVFGISRQGIVDVPWAHVYLTDPEFQEVLPALEPARSTVLTNFRAASHLETEALLDAVRRGADLVSVSYTREAFPEPFLRELFELVPELARIGPDHLGVHGFELLVRRR